ncbi:MAG: hypothetical protein ACJAWS_002278 [Oleiphilaceae bacterium]|jgi:hypothetical protein
MGTTIAIEFFEKDKRQDLTDMFNVGIIPYRTSHMAEMSLNDSEEIISGKFTGCVMSLYKRAGTLRAAHVDTNLQTTKRAVYDQMKSKGAIEVIDEYDTAGKLKVAGSVILCIANKTEIKHYVVSVGTHASHKEIPVPGEKGKFTAGQAGEEIYTILP